MRVIGIDPGSHRVGYAILDFPPNRPKKPLLLGYGTIECPPKTPSPDNLLVIRSSLVQVLDEFSPQKASLEELFFVQNRTTGMRVAESRGVILLTLGERGIPTVQPTATQIKKGISSKGNSTKSQIKSAIQMVLGFKDLSGHDDSWDAIACAYVGYVLLQNPAYSGYGQIKPSPLQSKTKSSKT